MANEDTSRRTHLSKGWWLLALIAVVLLYFLMLFVRSVPIEDTNSSPITEQLGEQLSPKKNDKTTLGTEKKAPEPLPIEAPKNESDTDESDTNESVQIAQIIIEEDATLLESLIEIKSYSTVQISIQTNTTSELLLSGVMPTQQDIDALHQASIVAFGEGKVVNELSVGERTAPSMILDELADFMPTLKGIKNGALEIAGNRGHISGQVASEQIKTEIVSKISSFLTGEIKDSMTFSRTANSVATNVATNVAKGVVVDSTQLGANKITEKHALLKKEAQELEETNQQVNAKKILVEKLELQICQEKVAQTMAGKTILFARNQSKLDTSSFVLLNTLIKVVNACGNKILDSKTTKIGINGYTDNRGREAYNMRLSQSRADAVKTYLVETGHLKPHFIRATGYGAAQPIASNDTKEGRVRNRRITILIY